MFLLSRKVKVLVAQLYLTLCNPIECSLLGSSVHGIFQARKLEWVAIPFSRGSSWLRDWIRVSCIAGESNGTPLPYSCLENPMDGGAWWAAAHGVAKSQTRLSNITFTFHFHAGAVNGNPLQCSCLENPRDGGVWWAAIYGIAQSQTWLKRLSSSNSACKLSKQGDNIQPWHAPFPIWNQSVVPHPVLTVASWPAYRFLKRQVRWTGIPISFRIFHSLLWATQSKALK